MYLHGESALHHAWYTRDAQRMSLAVPPARPFLSSKKESFGASRPQTLIVENGQRRSASWGWAWFRGHVVIGAGERVTEPSPNHRDLSTVSLFLLTKRTQFCLGPQYVDKSSHVTQCWPRTWRCTFWWGRGVSPWKQSQSSLEENSPHPQHCPSFF